MKTVKKMLRTFSKNEREAEKVLPLPYNQFLNIKIFHQKTQNETIPVLLSRHKMYRKINEKISNAILSLTFSNTTITDL